jgi:hypothetical protein
MALASLTLVLGFRRAVDRRWSAMESRVQELQHHLQAQGHPHAVLRGSPAPGDARTDYEAALHLMQDIEADELMLLHGHYAQGKTLKAEEIEAVFARFQGALDAFRRGVARETLTRVVWSEGAPQRHYPPRESLDLSYVAAYRARRLEELGRFRESWELILDTCRFDTDVEALIALDVAHLELARILRSPRLTPEEAKEIEKELEILDRDFPSLARPLEELLVSLGKALLRSRGGEVELVTINGYPEAESGWRQGFSKRLAQVEEFEEADRSTAELLSWGSLPWPEEKRRWQAFNDLRDARNRSWDTIMHSFESDRDDSNLPYRGARAQLRILRVAAHFRATGEILDLADPFGDRLETRRTGDALRIVSAGDEGSRLGKQNFQLHDRTTEVPTSIDLEVRR